MLLSYFKTLVHVVICKNFNLLTKENIFIILKIKKLLINKINVKFSNIVYNNKLSRYSLKFTISAYIKNLNLVIIGFVLKNGWCYFCSEFKELFN